MLRGRAPFTALLLALAVACSSLPESSLPPHGEHDVEAEFVVADDGRLVLPASSPGLVVHGLELDPPPLGERFGDGTRWFDYAPGTRVRVRGRFRTYAGADGVLPDARVLLPGAVAVRDVIAP